MNRERILAVADAIEAATRPEAEPVLGFNMCGFLGPMQQRDWTGHSCGTLGCVAGWTHYLRTGDLKGDVNSSEEFEWLDLHGGEFKRLFFPTRAFLAQPEEEADCADWGKITATQAVRTLRHLAETGTVDWSV